TLPPPNPFFQIGVDRRDNFRADEEKRSLLAIDRDSSAHHRFLAYRSVLIQIVPYFEPCDLQWFGRRRKQNQEQCHIPVPTVAVPTRHRDGMLDVLTGQRARYLAGVHHALRAVMLERF